MEHMLYWIWLTIKRGITPMKVTLLLEYFESIEEIYYSKNFNNIYGIDSRDRESLLNKDLSHAESVAEKTARMGAKIIVFDDENYPQLLKNIPNPPYVLYIQGKVPELDKVLTIGVVGTRKSSERGNTDTEKLSRGLAENGAVIIGGLAEGIDAVGAWAALDAGGIAVGVIGSGLDIVYPQKNAELYKVIASQGCIMTEYPLSSPPLRQHFPARNRIIAGLSRGVLVTEAPLNSGALITARRAVENNRDVFAVPRNINDTGFQGTNLLIQQGAKLVTCAEDIICEYPYAVKVPPMKKTVTRTLDKNENILPESESADSKKNIHLNESEKQILALLRGKDMPIDEMSRELKMPVNELNVKMLMLEMKGIVKKIPGNKYQLKI